MKTITLTDEERKMLASIILNFPLQFTLASLQRDTTIKMLTGLLEKLKDEPGKPEEEQI